MTDAATRARLDGIRLLIRMGESLHPGNGDFLLTALDAAEARGSALEQYVQREAEAAEARGVASMHRMMACDTCDGSGSRACDTLRDLDRRADEAMFASRASLRALRETREGTA